MFVFTLQKARMPTVKKFTITPLKFDAKLAEDVTRRRGEGESITTIAKGAETRRRQGCDGRASGHNGARTG
jgi:hypothetical protein